LLLCLAACGRGETEFKPIAEANELLGRAVRAIDAGDRKTFESILPEGADGRGVEERWARVLADLDRAEARWPRTAFLQTPAIYGSGGSDGPRVIELRLTFDLLEPPYQIGDLGSHGLVGAVWLLLRSEGRWRLAGATFEDFVPDAVALARSIESAPEAEAGGRASPAASAEAFLDALTAGGAGLPECAFRARLASLKRRRVDLPGIDWIDVSLEEKQGEEVHFRGVREVSLPAQIGRLGGSAAAFRAAARILEIRELPASLRYARVRFSLTTESAPGLCARIEARSLTIEWGFVRVRGRWMVDDLEVLRVR
jgi:hypothetical protein